MKGICASWAALAAAAVMICGTAALAQQWPTRAIVVVSPFAAGTSNDLVANMVLGPVGQALGQALTVENRPGGDGTVGVASVVKAAPDGYTLLLSSSAMSTSVILHKSLPYDVLRDLEPVAMFGAQSSVLVAAPAKGYQSVADLVAAAKAKPGQLKFGSVGIGSGSYVAGERFVQAAGLNVQHVAYRGAVEAIADLTAGRVDFYFLPVPPALPLIAQGKVVPLAVSSPQRSALLASVPTIAQAGYPIATYLFWDGLSAPAKTPPEIVKRLNEIIGKALITPGIVFKLERIGIEPIPMSPEQYAKFVADDVAAMIKLGKDANVAPTE
jgi:tripartite-type tricarboxylate transporter receptor subunit TctC